MASAVVEEYLETIYNMTMEGEPVIGARLAEKFRVSRPTVTETVRRLIADGYVVQDGSKQITLTAAGRELTEQVLRRHRLAERLLFDMLGLDWIEAHEQAHTLEHTMTDEVALRISERLGHPLTCPHGNPIPGNTSSGTTFLREQNAFRLSDAAEGQTVRVILVSEVVEDESEMLRRISGKGIHPSAILTLTATGRETDLVFEARGEPRSLPRDLASKIWVTYHTDDGSHG